jgi:hypothetical protein
MTSSTAKAPVELLPGSPTTKSLCPAGAGLIDQGEATKGAHTPPQACAAPAIDRATATTPATPHAQLAKGYKQVDEPCVQVPITWIQVLHEHNNIANNTPPSADPSVRAQVFYALDTCNGIIKGMHHLLSTTETPATTGHTTTEEDKMTTTDTIEDLQNATRAQYEYAEGLAGLLRQIRAEGLTDSLALQADQILQKHTSCSTCGGQAPDCPDCDGVRAKPEAPAEYPGTGEPVRRPEVAQRARELMAANPKLSARDAAIRAKEEMTAHQCQQGGDL